LDHNRGLYQIATKAGSSVTDISKFIIWGNHSNTQFPDISHATVKDKLATELLDAKWVNGTFIPTVQQRGKEIITARGGGASSAQSAASAIIDALHDWHFGTNSNWTSAAVVSGGEYGVTQGLFYSYPVAYDDEKNWDIVKNLPIDEEAAANMEKTHQELLQERKAVEKYLPKSKGDLASKLMGKR